MKKLLTVLFLFTTLFVNAQLSQKAISDSIELKKNQIPAPLLNYGIVMHHQVFDYIYDYIAVSYPNKSGEKYNIASAILSNILLSECENVRPDDFDLEQSLFKVMAIFDKHYDELASVYPNNDGVALEVAALLTQSEIHFFCVWFFSSTQQDTIIPEDTTEYDLKFISGNNDTVTVLVNSDHNHINVKDNDSMTGITNLSLLQLVTVQQPTHGNVSIVTNHYIYEPDSGFVGYDTITYKWQYDGVDVNMDEDVYYVIIHVTSNGYFDGSSLEIVQDPSDGTLTWTADLVAVTGVLDIDIVSAVFNFPTLFPANYIKLHGSGFTDDFTPSSSQMRDEIADTLNTNHIWLNITFMYNGSPIDVRLVFPLPPIALDANNNYRVFLEEEIEL